MPLCHCELHIMVVVHADCRQSCEIYSETGTYINILVNCFSSMMKKNAYLLMSLIFGLSLFWFMIINHQPLNGYVIYGSDTPKSTSHTETLGSHILNETVGLEDTKIKPTTDLLKPDTITKLYSTCQKSKNIAFLKIHKAGSSTVMNIFLRYGTGNNLNFVMPNTLSGTFNYLGNGVTLKKNRIIPLPANQTYNILCNHVVYNREAFDSVLPMDAKYIGIIRDPGTHFLSAGSYFGFFGNLEKQLNGAKRTSIDQLMSTFFNKNINTNTYYVHNKMSFDLGLPPGDFANEEKILTFLEKITSEVGLMMLMEHFDESILLMQKYLCWELKDVLYIEQNINKGSRARTPLSNETRYNLEKWNRADFLLYKHFKKIFWQKVEAQGPQFPNEVENFQKIRKQVVSFCRGRRNKTISLHIESSVWNSDFHIYDTDCRVMMTPELQMVTTIIKESFQKINMRIDSSGVYYADTNKRVTKTVHL
ncbi:hypothetical protein ScPMuIL_017770 [Solemya velum]